MITSVKAVYELQVIVSSAMDDYAVASVVISFLGGFSVARRPAEALGAWPPERPLVPSNRPTVA